MADPLATYLHDHLSGSRFAINLLDAMRTQNAGTDLGRFAAALWEEVEQDREELEELTDRIGSAGSGFLLMKEAGAWLAEKSIRLKLRRTRGGLGTLQALETLALGVQGKLALWSALRRMAEVDGRLTGFDFERLAARARSQHESVEEQRLRAAREMAASTAST